MNQEFIHPHHNAQSSTFNTPNSVEVIAKNLYDVGFQYNWIISDYLDGIDHGQHLDSPLFDIYVNGIKTTWFLSIRYWTDENNCRLTNPVVICLNLASSLAKKIHDNSDNIRAKYQFGIWNASVKQYEICPMSCSSIPIGTDSVQSIATRDIVILDRHLTGLHSIEIFCKIMLVSELEEPNSLGLDLWTKLRSGEHCDVTIKSNDGGSFPAHKTILLCRAPGLAKMFEQTDEILMDASLPVLTSLLQYIYTDRVDPLTSPHSVLKYAVNFNIPGLKRICEKFLLDSITPKNVAELLLIADTFECEQLKTCCLAYCGENSDTIAKTVAWKVMEKVNPDLFEEVCQQM